MKDFSAILQRIPLLFQTEVAPIVFEIFQKWKMLYAQYIHLLNDCPQNVIFRPLLYEK